MATKYLYEVHPLRPVLTPIEGRFTRRPFSADFTVEEVRKIMPNARVYRRFPDKMEIVPVTGENLEDLHRPKFNTDDTVEIVEKDDAKEEKIEVPEAAPAVTEPESKPQPAAVGETKEEVSAVEQVSTNEVVDTTEEVESEPEVTETDENTTSEAVSEEEVGNDENEVDSEEEASQEPEKQVSESKPNTVYVPNSNKFHKKKH